MSWLKANQRSLSKAEVTNGCMSALYSEENSLRKTRILSRITWCFELGPLAVTGCASTDLVNLHCAQMPSKLVLFKNVKMTCAVWKSRTFRILTISWCSKLSIGNAVKMSQLILYVTTDRCCFLKLTFTNALIKKYFIEL